MTGDISFYICLTQIDFFILTSSIYKGLYPISWIKPKNWYGYQVLIVFWLHDLESISHTKKHADPDEEIPRLLIVTADDFYAFVRVALPKCNLLRSQ